jgi:hypothetical protein
MSRFNTVKKRRAIGDKQLTRCSMEDAATRDGGRTQRPFTRSGTMHFSPPRSEVSFSIA